MSLSVPAILNVHRARERRPTFVCRVSHVIEIFSLEAWFNIVYDTYIHKYYFKYIHTYTHIYRYIYKNNK